MSRTGKRTARLNEQLKRELSHLIRTQVRDPRIGPVTITGVDVAADLGSARVYVRTSSLGTEEPTLDGLQAAASYLRSTLGRILRLRRIPELRFQIDHSQEHAHRIEELLSEIDTLGGAEESEDDST
ncbi:MAG: 30S ribosome-binding factor RbfA [Gemmatimonadota bacterium]|nr:30S ribosome-binding factor RbfA [Gemmatimonadota bacterium]